MENIVQKKKFYGKGLTLKEKYDKIHYCVEPHSTTAQKRFEKLKIVTLMASLRLLKGGLKMKAVIETGGKQYYVSEGAILYVEKLDNAEGSTVTFDKVLMIDGKSGNPYVKGASVQGKIVKHGKAKKITIFKFRAKKKYRRTQGHRQPYTKVEITKISTK